MSKKKLILSQKQLDEICGGDCSYLDGLANKPDMGDVFSKEISSDGSIDGGYAHPTTTDHVSHDMTNNWRGNAKLHGMGPITVREMKKSDWDREYLSEEGNSALKNMKFGASSGEEGKSYAATKTNLSRRNAAMETMRTGATPEIKQKAADTLDRMQNNWEGMDTAAKQYNAVKNTTRTINNNKPTGEKRASSLNGLPKIDGGTFIS